MFDSAASSLELLLNYRKPTWSMYKKNKLFFLIIAFSLLKVATATDLCTTLGGVIVEDATLDVPSDYPTIQAALACVNDKEIPEGVTVTIQVADGTYTDYETIQISHSQGSRINIIGNTTSPDQLVIKFKASTKGILLEDGSVLGLIDGFTFDGVNKSANGITVNDSSHLTTGSSVVCKNFKTGLRANRNSTVRCPYIVVNYNDYGIIASGGADVYCGYSEAKHNTNDGYHAQYMAHLDARESTASNNANGFYANTGAYMTLSNATATSNSSLGVCATNGAYIQASGVTSSSNGTNYSPAINTVNNGNSYIRQ